MRKLVFFPLALVVFALVSVAGTFGQNKVDPEKLALIKEFLQITEATKGAAETSDMMLGLQAEATASTVNALIDNDEDIPPEMKEELKKTIAETSERSDKRIREFFAGRLNFAQIIEEVAVSVYDKHFTAGQLRDIIAFYKTPTGKRLIEVTPALTSDLMTGMMEKMGPKLQDFIKEAAEAELKILKEAKHKP